MGSKETANPHGPSPAGAASETGGDDTKAKEAPTRRFAEQRPASRSGNARAGAAARPAREPPGAADPAGDHRRRDRLGMDADASPRVRSPRIRWPTELRGGGQRRTGRQGQAREAPTSQPASDGSAGTRIHCAASRDRMVPVDGGPARDLRASAVTVDLDAAAHRPFRHRPLARRPRAGRRGILSCWFRTRIEINNLRKGAYIWALALRDVWAGRHCE